MSFVLNQSGEPSKEVETSKAMEENSNAQSNQGGDTGNSGISMSFIRQILSKDDSVKAVDDSAKRGVSFTGIDTGSVASSTADDDKDHEELLTKIQTLKLDLKQAKLDLSAEKTMNRKKDRNLVKLAKELNRRGEEIVEKNKAITEV